MNKSFFVGKYEERLVVAVKCGIGKVAASLTTTLIIEHFKPDLVISTGIAGTEPFDVYIYAIDYRGSAKVGSLSRYQRVTPA